MLGPFRKDGPLCPAGDVKPDTIADAALPANGWRKIEDKCFGFRTSSANHWRSSALHCCRWLANQRTSRRPRRRRRRRNNLFNRREALLLPALPALPSYSDKSTRRRRRASATNGGEWRGLPGCRDGTPARGRCAPRSRRRRQSACAISFRSPTAALAPRHRAASRGPCTIPRSAG